VANALEQALSAGGSISAALDNFRVASVKKEAGQVEEITVDVLGIGLGNSGIMASRRMVEVLQSKNGGRPVSYLGIEKAAKLGGQSGMAHELFIINPPRMKAEFNNGQDYLDAGRLRNYWLSHTMGSDGRQRAKEDLIDLYINRSGEMLDWLHYEHGYIFETPKVGDLSASAQEEKFVGTFNLLTFNMSYETRRKQVLAWATKLMDEVVAAGGAYMLETEGYEFLYDNATGSVSGAKARNLATGKEYIIHAKAVIMATGGFGGGKLTNTLYSNRYYPLQGDWRLLGMAQNDGKMLKAALDIGAGEWNIGMPPIHAGPGALAAEIHDYPVNIIEGQMNNRSGRTNTWSINDIPEGFITYNNVMFFNQAGRRINNEVVITNSVGNEPDQFYHAGPFYYVLIDEAALREVRDKGFPRSTRWRQYTSQGGVPVETPQPQAFEVMETAIKMGMVFKGNTLQELASSVGVDASALQASFDRYNQLCAAGKDDDFGKDPSLLKAYGSGPYYAIKAYFYPFGSGGGLDVDTQIRVLKTDHKTPINGLYATGGDSLGVLMSDQRNYNGLGGPANGWAYFSGYIAGESCADYVYNLIK
jgi:fumarate reductase flavoprotein subunit